MKPVAQAQRGNPAQPGGDERDEGEKYWRESHRWIVLRVRYPWSNSTWRMEPDARVRRCYYEWTSEMYAPGEATTMISRRKCILTLLLTAGVLFGATPVAVFAQAAGKDRASAVFSGGCFWGVDAVFKHVKGVSKVVSGYAGGAADTANYETVSTG